MRLIDADSLRQDWLENGENEYVYDTNSFLFSIDEAPTIDPETLPIVHKLKAKIFMQETNINELRKQLAEVTAERNDLKREIREASLCYMCKNNGVICHKSNPKTDPDIMCGSFKWRGRCDE